MEWIILFVISWILFILLANWKELKTNIWCGIIAIILQMGVDTQAINYGYYFINKPVVKVLGSSLFFIIGPVFVIGTLIAQYHPKKSAAIIIFVFTLAALFSIQEVLLLTTGSLTYINWNHLASVVVNVSAMMVLSWFCIVVLNKRRKVQQ